MSTATSTSTADLADFEPGIYIRIDDVMTGGRKLARVTQDGRTYLDLDTDDCTPLPIYTTLNPEEAGNILGWGLAIVDTQPQLHAAWQSLCDQLINSGEGVLTYNRAAHWAFLNHNFDFAQAMAAAKAETNRVAEGRKALDDIAKKAGGLV